MLQSLHSLQQENQRLQDQILGLTAKKDRLQLLNTELAVPFPPLALSASLQTSAQISFLSPSQGERRQTFSAPFARVASVSPFNTNKWLSVLDQP